MFSKALFVSVVRSRDFFFVEGLCNSSGLESIIEIEARNKAKLSILYEEIYTLPGLHFDVLFVQLSV